MHLAFSTNAFKKYSLEESIRAIANIGYEGVEILGDVPHAYPPLFGEEQIQSAKEIFLLCASNTFTAPSNLLTRFFVIVVHSRANVPYLLEVRK
jgi:sugar phosphate isomerase/epimerase